MLDSSPKSLLEPTESQELPRVLVVDDDERNLLAIATVLEDIGTVVQARSGEEALRHLLKDEFAVILLDVYMPGMDGYEAAQIIRNREQTKRIPIVFLSAVNKETEHLMRGYAMGAVDYVFKPVEPVVLRSKVAVFVDLFAKTKEIEAKARQEQALLDENLRANNERWRAEQELRRAEQRQGAIIESLPIILYLEQLDCDPRCPDFVSGNLQAMTGFTFEQVRATPSLWAERIHRDDRARVLEALRERQANQGFSIQYRWQCADGTYKYFHDRAVLLRDGHGRPVEFAGTLTDVTEQRSLESQLIQAQKMDAIGKLTGGVAHDFNNLLAAVIGGLSLIERRASLDASQQQILAMTRHAAEQGTELVGRLLAFARRQQLQPANVDIEAMESSVSGLLAHTLGGLVQLDWGIPKGIWQAFADPAQLELAMMNLIINARDAMKDGGTVAITAENRMVQDGSAEELKPGHYVVLTVSDTGCGIPAEMMEEVLQPFVTTKEIGKGTGLGLSMVYGFARQSNGAFRLESRVGEGTKAEIWLPRAARKEARLAKKVPAAEIPQGRPLNVLVVDDHAEVRSTTVGMLEELGHVVREAPQGHEALTVLNGNGECDLLITDYAMPNMSGAELVREARKLKPDLKSMIITGYADNDTLAANLDNTAVLAKPFNLEKLAEAINLVVAASERASRRAN
jgi:PAS domain S-box-containing protein